MDDHTSVEYILELVYPQVLIVPTLPLDAGAFYDYWVLSSYIWSDVQKFIAVTIE